jgi:hypothetical protein
MILGCHRQLDDAIRSYGQDALDAADAALVKAAYDSKLAWAFQQSDPDCKPHVFERALMVPWYIADFISWRDKPNPRPTTVDPYLSQVDMDLMRRVIAERAAVMQQVSDARHALLMADSPNVEAAFQDDLPDVTTACCWPDGSARRVFHVTPVEFTEFKPVSHFGSAVAVSRHADKSWRYGRDHEDLRVIGASLQVSNPLQIVDDGQMSSCWLVVAAHKAGALNRAEPEQVIADREWRYRPVGEDYDIECELVEDGPNFRR